MRLARSVTLVGLVLAFSAANAQTGFPNRPMKLVVPAATGGLTDILGRLLGQRLAERLGQPVVIENRAGGGGIAAMEYIAKAPPDGYSLVIGFPGPLVVNQFLYKSLPYDPVKSLAPVTLVATTPRILVAHPSLPANNIRELVELLRRNPGRYFYGSAGNGTIAHLSMEMLTHMTGVEAVHVPYKGSGPLMTDLLAGRVHLDFDSPMAALQYVQSGKLKVLGITSAKRSPLWPDIPAIAESGVPEFEVTGWYGILTTAGTPAPIVTRLGQELRTIVTDPATREQLVAHGVETLGKDGAEFARFMAAEAKVWGTIVKQRNITPAD